MSTYGSTGPEGIRPYLRRNVSLPLLILLIVYTMVRSAYWQVVPIWDGREYYDYLLDAFAPPFDILRWSTGGHLCQGFYFIIGAPLLWSSRNYVLFNIGLTGFSMLSIIGFYQLAGMITPRAGRWEKTLCAALFAFHPTVLSNMINVNPDAGVLTFILLFWLALWKGWGKTACACCLLALFSKETAAILLPFPFAFCFLEYSAGPRWKWLRRHAYTLILPYLLMAAFLYYKVHFRHAAPLWGDLGNPNTILQLIASPSLNPGVMNYLFMMFALNFQWLLTALGILFLLIGIIKWKNIRLPLLLILLLLANAYALTRITSFANTRYVMITAPLLLLGMWSTIPYGMAGAGKRIGLYSVLLLLLGVQDIRTVDPVSRAWFGTFAFGNHQILFMTSQSHECCGYGRDQLVYNLEYLKFQQIIMKILQDIRPSADTIITSPSATDWFLWTALDKHTYRPTFEHGGFVPHFVSVGYLMNQPVPPRAYFIGLPYIGNDNAEAEMLSKRYAIQKESVYDMDGYKINLILFANKAPVRSATTPRASANSKVYRGHLYRPAPMRPGCRYSTRCH